VKYIEKKRLGTNSLWNIGNYLFSISILFFLFPFIVNNLGENSYGFFIFLSTINGIASIANFGFGEATLRYVAYYHAQRDIKSIKHIISTSFWTYFVLGILTSAVVFIFAGSIIGLLKDSAIQSTQAINFVRLSILTFLIRFVWGIFGTIPQALERYDMSSKVSILESILRLTFYVITIKLGLGIKGLVYSEIFIALIISFTNYLISSAFFRTYWFFQLPSLKYFKISYNYSIFAFLTQIVGLLWQYTDRLLLGYFIGTAAIAYFSIPQQIIFKILGVITAASAVLFPRFSGTTDNSIRRNIFKSTTLLSLISSIIIFSTLSLIIGDFLALWISPSFAASAKVIATILAISCMIRGAFVVYENFFKGIGKPKYNFYIIILSSLIIVLFNIILIPLFGLNGAGIAYLISPLAGVFTILVIWKKIFKDPLIEVFKYYFAPLLISYLILLVGLWIKKIGNFEVTWISLLIQAFTFFIIQVGILVLYYFQFTKYEIIQTIITYFGKAFLNFKGK
jgi:O-antigen/teichoic acid export membrane protein